MKINLEFLITDSTTPMFTAINKKNVSKAKGTLNISMVKRVMKGSNIVKITVFTILIP